MGPPEAAAPPVRLRGTASCPGTAACPTVLVETAALLPQMPEMLLSIIIPSNYPRAELLPRVSP